MFRINADMIFHTYGVKLTIFDLAVSGTSFLPSIPYVGTAQISPRQGEGAPGLSMILGANRDLARADRTCDVPMIRTTKVAAFIIACVLTKLHPLTSEHGNHLPLRSATLRSSVRSFSASRSLEIPSSSAVLALFTSAEI
jgi:hypothetical protein